MERQEKKEKFEKVAFEYMDSLFNTALRMTHDPMEAEDLVQDAYLRAYRFFDKFQEGTKFQKLGFLKILKNTFINKYRKWVRTPHQVQLEKVDFGLKSNEDFSEYDKRYEFNEDSYRAFFDDEITAALNELSDDFKMVVLLTDVEGFSYKETAEIIERPIGTVMSRLSRGRKMLREVLGQYAEREGYVKSYAAATA